MSQGLLIKDILKVHSVLRLGTPLTVPQISSSNLLMPGVVQKILDQMKREGLVNQDLDPDRPGRSTYRWISNV